MVTLVTVSGQRVAGKQDYWQAKCTSQKNVNILQ